MRYGGHAHKLDVLYNFPPYGTIVSLNNIFVVSSMVNVIRLGYP